MDADAADDAEADAEFERFRWALSKVEGVIRKRNSARAFTKVVEEAKSLFLDERALAAGAASNSLYSIAALAIRKGLSTDPVVEGALDEAWLAISTAVGGSELTRDDYATMNRKLYLALEAEERDHDVDVNSFLGSLDDDWQDDAQGLPTLDGEAFRRCWFQLADTNTDSISAEEYAGWVRKVIGRITQWVTDGDGQRQCIWALDAHTLGWMQTTVRPEERRVWQQQRSRWEGAFREDEERVAAQWYAHTLLVDLDVQSVSVLDYLQSENDSLDRVATRGLHHTHACASSHVHAFQCTS